MSAPLDAASRTGSNQIAIHIKGLIKDAVPSPTYTIYQVTFKLGDDFFWSERKIICAVSPAEYR